MRAAPCATDAPVALTTRAVLALVGRVTDGETSVADKQAALTTLLDAYTHFTMHKSARAVLERAYGALFSCLDESAIQEALCILLCCLTRRGHVRAFRIRKVRTLYAGSARDPGLYALLDTYATYYPALLLPVEQPASHTQRERQSHASATFALCLRHWARSLAQLVLPDIVPGLCIHAGDATQSRVPRLLYLALLLGVGMPHHEAPQRDAVDQDIGARIATSLGRVMAVNHVYQIRQQKRVNARLEDDVKLGPGQIPCFDPIASAVLDQVYLRCAAINNVPPTLFTFLAHVVQSMGADAVERLRDGQIAEWERVWYPTVVAIARLFSRLHPAPWDELVGTLVRPLCHLATMDGVSDLMSATVVQGLVRLLEHWSCTAPHAQDRICALRQWLLELEEAVLMDGDPPLPIYHAALDLHLALARTGCKEGTHAFYPFPFFLLAMPSAMAGSVATLARLCQIVLLLRTAVMQTAHALDVDAVNAMLLALVDMLWSGRAYGAIMQHGLRIDGQIALDYGTAQALKQAADACRIVPFVLVASLSHSALLAPLFEQFCNTRLLPPAQQRPFLRGPITPSALRPARAFGLPANLPYAEIRVQFLAWLAERHAPEFSQLLQATVPSLQARPQ
ncbi:hypothetical protein MVES1_001597 [Malassezia vespertilionis]|uniref:Uncharacterized protein n=1 Tax=Malassezia vespertilionis TaxID=2020962 RepID=A0A2N1JCT2_9BASI|nr:uncharacterized protein MVES1_001597 [Malassezia vespertilionis]PKI84349.1 hypothetical protein MVES_001504 [Malassezia vespertilionis]WFD06252.1 hypothetical protein MVES1_001597 [Malassezia vespertilionis]